LLEHDVDVVAAPIVKKTDTEHTYSVKLLGEYSPKENGLVEVDGCATGFFRVRFDAIKKMYEAAEPYKEPQKQKSSRMVFEVKVVDGDLWAEDIIFCDKWRKMGGKVYIDPTINCGHSGEKRWISDFSNWIRNAHPKSGS
jgi:hypothetical protein